MKRFPAEIAEMTKLLSLSGLPKGAGLEFSLALERLFCPLPDLYAGGKRSEWARLSPDDQQTFRSELRRLRTVCTLTEPKCGRCPVAAYCNARKEALRAAQNPAAPTFVDLFCGAGGLSLGFRSAGFRLSLANDIDPACIDTYRFNHPETPEKHIVCGDINDILRRLPALLQLRVIDVVIGGPPCQGFSTANRQQLIDDPRNHLYKKYIQVVRQLHPKFIVMENVKGMLPVAEQIREDFKTIGYTVSAQVLNARDFGVPQNRERLIFIGNRIKADNEKIFTELRARAKETAPALLSDALHGLCSLHANRVSNSTEMDSDVSGCIIESNHAVSTPYLELINGKRRCPYVFNHKARYNNDRDIQIFGRLKEGDRSDDPKIADIMPYQSRSHIFKDKYFKLEHDKPCKTITAHMRFDCNMYIHPTEARGLTPREAARVQSYPDDYFFRGPYSKTYAQIGNSVPPLLSRALARALKPYL